MSSPPSLLDYARRAFLFRPWGMPVPPNLFALGAFGLLSLREPGFLVVGLGVELLYLLAFVTNGRFRGLVDREHAQAQPKSGAFDAALAKLSLLTRKRYQALQARCEALLDHADVSDALGSHHADALAGLLQVYLQLLGAREGVARLVDEADPSVEARLAEVARRIASADGELRASLEGQRDVLTQRLEGQRAAARKLAYVDGELQRVEDQVELLREQALLDAGATAVGTKIDAIAAALSQTRQWLADERVLLGEQEVPAPVLRAAHARRRVPQ